MPWVYDVEGGRWVDDPAPTPYQRLSGDDPSISWVNSMIQDPSGWMQATDVAPAGPMNQGLDANRVLMGGFGVNDTFGSNTLEGVLKSIAQAAGKPDFDWTLAKARAAQQHYNQYGSTYIPQDSDWSGLVTNIVQSAQDPSLAQVLAQYGPSIDQQLKAAQEQYKTMEEQRDASRHRANFAALAAPVAAWALAPAAAGAAGSAGTTGAGQALGTGISAGAGGASGLSAGAGGAAGISGLGAAGTSLAPGFFAAESLAPVLGGATAATLGGGSAGAGTALSRVINGTATTADYLSLAGQALPSVLGMIGSNQQSKALEGIAGQYMAMGAPYRQKLADITNDPSKFYNSPEATQALDAMARKFSATGGNPAGSPYGQSLLLGGLYDRYGAERDRLAGYGGLTAYNAAAPGAAQAAAGTIPNQWNAFGVGLDRVLNPQQKQPTLAQLLGGATV